ncbi:MAG: replication-relaxation family protein [Candidatus Saccharibacteria bacterium]
MREPKYRRPLNPQQITILNTLYKFRFTTIALFAKNQQANPRVISNRLKILVDQGYIGMNYNSSYMLKGKPATYYLATKGVRFLRTQPYSNESALRSIYHDKRAEDHRINHRLNVFKAYIQLKHTYPNRFKFYSKTELMDKAYVPKTRPDAYIVDKETDKSYFLECLEDNMTYWTLRKTVRKYITFAELEVWHKYKPRKLHPEVLLICESAKLEKTVGRLVEKALDRSYASVNIRVTEKGVYII